MPHCDGWAARRILERDGEREVSEDERVRIIMLTTFDIDEYVYSAVRAGASGFLFEGHPARALLEAIPYGAPRRCGDCAVGYSPPTGAYDSGAGLPRSCGFCHRVCIYTESVQATPSAAGALSFPKATFIPADSLRPRLVQSG